MSYASKLLGALGLAMAMTACGGDSTTPDNNPPPPPPGPAPVASITVGPAATITVGKTGQLTAVAKDAQGHELQGRAITWASAAEGTATVSAAGLVSGIAPGAATITASSEGKNGSVAVTITPVPVASVALEPATVTLKVGRDTALIAAAKDEADGPLPGRILTFTSSNPGVATVDAANGKVTGVAAGAATITALAEGKTATSTITVVPVAVASVVLAPADLNLSLGRDTTLVATPRDESDAPLGGRAIAFESSNPAVATVDAASGKVVAVGLGAATIKATSEGKSGTAAITVVPVPVASVSVTPGTVSLKLGRDTALAAAVKDDHGAQLPGRAIAWSTSNPAVATVNATTGVVTAVESGNATITAASEGKTGTAAITVIAPVASVVIAPAVDTVEAHDLASSSPRR